jgi:hypothetical protein
MRFRFAHSKALLFLVVGVVYGAALVFMGFLLADIGHGSYVLLFIASAPFGLGGAWPMVIFPPLMWGLVGWLIGSLSRFQQRFALALTLLHYVSLPCLSLALHYPERQDLVKMFSHDRQYAVIGTAAYFLGQLLIWVCWLTRTRLR